MLLTIHFVFTLQNNWEKEYMQEVQKDEITVNGPN